MSAPSSPDKKRLRQEESDPAAGDEQPSKRARTDVDEAKPARFRNLVVDVGEECSTTGVFVIEGDLAGRGVFEALVSECKVLDETMERGPVTSYYLLSMTDNKFDIMPWSEEEWARAMKKRFQEAAVNYRLTVVAYSLDDDKVQGWTEGGNCLFLWGVY